MHLVQHRVTTIKTISAHWLFILQPIKKFNCLNTQCVQFYWKARFFPYDLQIGDIFTLGNIVWMLNFFFSTGQNFIFFLLSQISFSFYSTYIRVFNFRQIFKGKSHTWLIFKSISIRKYTVFFLSDSNVTWKLIYCDFNIWLRNIANKFLSTFKLFSDLKTRSQSDTYSLHIL